MAAGDLGRWREGGMIDLLGRKDFQAQLNLLVVPKGGVQ